MAERRMFAKTIIDSDAFLDMPLSSQALYFHLSMRADDDGFLNNARKIMKIAGANQNDYDLLLAKRFVIQLDDGICVIKHWRIHNYIQNDRYKPTVYQDKFKNLAIKSNKSYVLKNDLIDTEDVILIENNPDKTKCIHNVSKVETQVRLDKYSIDKYSILLVNDEEYIINQELFNSFKDTYKFINVEEEILKIQSWCLSNPTKRKTRKGALRFVNGWLNRANDQKMDKQSSNQKNVKNTPDWYNEYETDLKSRMTSKDSGKEVTQQDVEQLAKDLFK